MGYKGSQQLFIFIFPSPSERTYWSISKYAIKVKDCSSKNVTTWERLHTLFVLPAFSFSSRALGSGLADYCHKTLPNPCVSFLAPLSVFLSPSLSLWFYSPGTFFCCNNLLFLFFFLPQWPFYSCFQFFFLFSDTRSLTLLRPYVYFVHSLIWYRHWALFIRRLAEHMHLP